MPLKTILLLRAERNIFNLSFFREHMNAIEKAAGPCVVFAGAGTGKTYTIVEKIKYLIKNRVYSPERIVCITFSNEAADNLSSRVGRALDLEIGKEPIIKTFHAFSAYLLREFGNKIGINKDFKILDPDSAKVLLYKNFRVNGRDCQRYVSAIGTLKDLGIGIEDYEGYLREHMPDSEENVIKKAENLEFQLRILHLKSELTEKKDLSEKIEQLKDLIDINRFLKTWKAYEKLKNKGGFLDYSDLSRLAIKLLEKNEDVANNFNYVIVDEFQDTNKIQIDLLTKVAKHGNITVVGDMNQSIYRFRGAYRDNLAMFNEHFKVKGSDFFNLSISFRSPNKILRTAHTLIKNNYKNEKECFFVENADKKEGEKIQVYEMLDGKEEARKIAEIVEQEIEKGINPEEICVMCRTHQQGRVIKKILGERGIDYCSVGKNSLLKEKSVRSALSYLRILSDNKKGKAGEEKDWWDLFFEGGFLGKDLAILGKFLKENKCLDNFQEKLAGLELSGQGKEKLGILFKRLEMMRPAAEKKIDEAIEEIYRIGGLLKKIYNTDDKKEIINLGKFRDFVNEYEKNYASDLNDFLNYVDIMEELEIGIESAELENKGVRLMTSHSTKGLEFKTIILANFAEGRFPMLRVRSNSLIPISLLPEIKESVKLMDEKEKKSFFNEYERKNQIAEERRLCYVAFTRSKMSLKIIYSKNYGGKEFRQSRFLDEINYKENEDIEFIQDNEKKYKEIENTQNPELRTHEHEGSVFDAKFTFSPSSLLTFLECQKKFEYEYVYNMPEKRSFSWEAQRLGSFIHLVLQEGVKRGFKSGKEFEDLAKDMQKKEEWTSVELKEALMMIGIFYERNKEKYRHNSMTEQCLRMNVEGFRFIGFADRIDFLDNGIEIIDYKTGKNIIEKKHRDWQLGYYALAAQNLGKVRKVTLDMLNHEKPLEFEIDENGNAKEMINGRMSFNVNEIKDEMVSTAKSVLESGKNGFKPCPIDKNCDFCNEIFYGI